MCIQAYLLTVQLHLNPETRRSNLICNAVASGPVATSIREMSSSWHVQAAIKPPPAFAPEESVATKPPNVPDSPSIEISPSETGVRILDGWLSLRSWNVDSIIDDGESAVAGNQRIAMSTPLYSKLKRPCCVLAVSLLIPEMVRLVEEKLVSLSSERVNPKSSITFDDCVSSRLGLGISVGVAVNVGTGVGDLVGTGGGVAFGGIWAGVAVEGDIRVGVAVGGTDVEVVVGST